MLLKRSKAGMKTLIVYHCNMTDCQVWHFNIQNYLSDDIERVQKRALKIIVPLLQRGNRDCGYYFSATIARST